MRTEFVDREPFTQSVADALAASAFCGDAGLAAIAAEFDLRIDELEPDLAAAVALGAALLAPQRHLLAA
jgi:hypothetical protein